MWDLFNLGSCCWFGSETLDRTKNNNNFLLLYSLFSFFVIIFLFVLEDYFQKSFSVVFGFQKFDLFIFFKKAKLVHLSGKGEHIYFQIIKFQVQPSKNITSVS